MIRLKMKNYDMIVIEKQLKYKQLKFINMNILLVKIYYHLIKDQGKKQADALENLKPKQETKPTEDK